MAFLFAVVNAVLALLLFESSTASSDTLAPKWSSSYYIQGEILVPYADVSEPFQAWFDLDSSNSRIDYYNGMAKTYQLSNKGSFGASLKIVPVTTETETNSIKCLEVNGSDSFHISPQSALPDLTNFKLIGKYLENGIEVEKWMSVSKVEKTVSKYTMTLYRQDDVIYPLKFLMNGFNSVFGSHFDNYIIEYKNFSPSKPDPNIFNVDDLNCESFPGPGIDHVYTFNPMMEFINNYGEHVDSAFEKYQHLHNKNYKNGTAEHFNRKNNFRHNLRYIHSKNRANLGYTLAVNHLADFSNEELKSLCGYKKSTNIVNGGDAFPYDKNDFKDLPSSVDWRIAGAVTPVKDQSVCGSCWSFGTTGTIEGAYFLKHGERKSFSEQSLVDCSWGFGNNGCDGGEDFRAYSWIKLHGIPTEEEYGPYLSQDGLCHLNGIPNGDRTKITGFVNVTAFDEEALKIALIEKGPISIAIFAALKSFSFYSTGVYYDKDCLNNPTDLDHAVLLVGYGTLNGKPYWLVKNSWSTHWGNDGYILISRKKNNCGVLTSPTYVTL